MGSTAHDVQAALAQHASPSDAVFLQRFFKTGAGQYGEGDVFIGVRVPQTRAVCKQFHDLPLGEIQKLLNSAVHEHRLAAVILLSNQYKRAAPEVQREIFDLYLRNVHSGRVNNWDIVDSSAEFIVGPYLADKPKDILFALAKNKSVWCRRVAVLASFAYIKEGEPEVTVQLAELLLHDTHDLIQKAVGWMLREIGKHGQRSVQLAFLDAHAAEMPRTMLRYAIEHLSPEQKQRYMQAKLLQ